MELTVWDDLQVFRYQNRLFFITWDDDKNRCFVRCLGWSIKPIQEMLDEAHESFQADLAHHSIEFYMHAGECKASPHMPHSQDRTWGACIQVPVRSIGSVEMNSQEKAALVSDIDKYLAGYDWYRRRCIPWRRGYLLHGPPGTGKTSLITALATHFRLPVYSIALSEDLTDKKLHELLRNVNMTNSIVLFEDIDSAGLTREEQGGDTRSPDESKEESNPSTDMVKGDSPQSSDNAKAGEAQNAEKAKAGRPKCRVTLSGFLNAIDGVGAPEGQILVSSHQSSQDYHMFGS